MDDNYQEFIPNVNFELIPIEDLTSSQDYQRNISMKHVKRAAEHFDLYQINPVKVSRRDGINYVFNGQHTVEIIALKSGSRKTPVWCMVYNDLVYEHEADIFANQLKYTRSLSPYEIFMANIEAGNDKELFIKDIVESYGLKIGASKAPGYIVAVAALENIFEDFGYDILDSTLRVAIGTWEGIPDSLSEGILKGIALMLCAYGELFNEEIFKEKLGRVPVKIVTRNAKERGNGTVGMAEYFVIEYNKKMKGGCLAMIKLYDAEKKRKLQRKMENQQFDALVKALPTPMSE